MLRKSFSLGFACCLLGIGLETCSAVAQKPLPRDWLSQARKGWSEIQQRPVACRWRAEGSVVAIAGSEHESSYRISGKRLGNSVVREYVASEPDGTAFSLDGRNADYAFRLSRVDPDKPWVIREVVQNSDLGSKTSDIERLIEISVNALDQRRINLFDEILPYIFDHPDVQVTSALLLTERTPPVAEIKFLATLSEDEVSPTFRVPSFQSISSGTVLLTPMDSWSLVEAELITKSGNLFRKSYKSGVPEHTDFIVESVQTRESSSFRHVDRFFDLAFDCPDLSEADFRLTAFGLPEPDFSKPSPVAPWMGVLGAIGVALGIWFLSRRGNVQARR